MALHDYISHKIKIAKECEDKTKGRALKRNKSKTKMKTVYY